jgi:hypothetical protein
MIKVRIFILFIFCGLSTWVMAQKTVEFSKDPKIFATQLKEFFAQDNHPEVKQVMDDFLELWGKNNAFTPSEQAKIIDHALFMQKQKLKVYPDFLTYIRLMNVYKTSKIPETKLDQYHEVALSILQSKAKKNYKDFNLSIENLFAGIFLYKSDIRSWHASNDVYDIAFDKEPVITFPKMDLQLLTRGGDTMNIFETAGSFYPLSNKFNGSGGTVLWTRVGFEKEKAYATLNKYRLDIRNSEYRADSVSLFFPKVFDKPITGKIDDKATTEYLGRKSSYPRFQSYQNVFTIKNIFDNVDYHGGFTLEGAQIQGTGNDTDRAAIIFYRGNKIVMRALSKSFTIAPDRISALKSAVSIYLDQDSIYHTQAYFTYIEKSRTVTIGRDNVGLYSSPFYDSYHQFEFSTGNLIWNIDSSTIYMKTIANPGGATSFESSEYYTEGKYLGEQGILDYNPIERLRRIALNEKKRIFTEAELAGQFNTKPEFLSSLMFQLAREGFVFYDVDGHKITIKDKLVHYSEAANKNADYDIIHFESIISKLPNAALDLNSNDLIIQGVPYLNISDSQNTFFIPKDQVVTIKKNKDMKFVGQVHSGRFDFYGTEMTLNYAKFKIDLNNLDSVKFKYPEFDKSGKQVGMRTIQSTIQNVNGYLYIDEPGNKSGKKLNPDYPIFECNKESYVYYQKPTIFNNVYDKERFYFKIDPFIIKNLDKFTAEGLRFPGAFTSADILPVFRNELTIMEDFSLGFITNTPAEGWALYKTKGTAKGTFKLSNKGLREDGEADYLDAKMYSDNFIYFPDSMNSNTKTFDIPQIAGGKFPPMAGADLYNHWMPYNDSLYIIHKKSPLSVYNGKIDFAGDLVLTPQELVGIGNMKYQDLDIDSKAFAFLPKNIKTKDGNLKIKAETGTKSAVDVKNITADVDLEKDFGTFNTNDDTAKVNLPSNRFATTLNNFTYDIKNKEVNFVKNDKIPEEDAYFVSQNPDQNGLKFNSEKAIFKINKQTIKAEDVPHINIADAKIYTPNKEIQIEKEGTIGAIKGAEIFADGETKLHRIYNAYVNIFGSNKFTGYGDFDYLDKNDKVYKIYFSDIRIDENGHTVAKGEIKDTANFFLAPGIRFSGTANMLSIRKSLQFDGYILPDHQMAGLRSEWTKMTDTIDPKNVVINIEHPVGKDGHEIFTGVFVAAGKNMIYNVMYGKKMSPEDAAVFTTNGMLYYNEKTGEYVVGPKAKIQPEGGDTSAVGNVFRAMPGQKKVSAEGSFDFGAQLKHVEVKTAGLYKYDYTDTSNVFNVAMIVNFPLHDDVYKIMIDTILDVAPGLFDVDNNKSYLVNAFGVLIQNPKDREKVMSDLSGTGVVPVVDETNKMFVFTELNMTYFDTSHSFVSMGDVGLANSKQSMINKKFKGVVEVRKSSSGDKFSLIIGNSNGGYYYFSYLNGVLGYQASDQAYTDKIKETEPKFLKANKGLSLRLATVREVNQTFRKSRRK